MRVGIIYPNETDNQDIKGWLKPYSAGNQIVSFTTLPQAVPLINKFPCDLLITGDRFAEAQGASLLKGLRKLCPNAQVIMLATFAEPIEALLAETHSDLNVHYFPQPWDKQSLLAHIEASIGVEAPPFTTALVLDETQSQRISGILENLQKETGAISVYLVTHLGQVLDYKGSELTQIGEISSLLGGSFAALNQLSSTFAETAPADSLIHRQGSEEDVYALSVSDSALLVLRFLHSASTPRIGTVSFYARQTVSELASILAESKKKLNEPLMDEEAKDAISSELDQLFGAVEPTAEKNRQPKPSEPLLSFSEALDQGLITKGLEGRFEAARSNKEDKLSEEKKA